MTTPSRAAPVEGSRLAERYELVRHLARGGMADVYEATDHQLQRQVAVKVFRAAAASDRARFDAEVVVLAALNHPGLVQVYDAGDQDGDAFVVLELVDGPTLATRSREHGPFPALEVAQVGTQVADALAYVHERGVVHRDVTPSNVLCGPDGRPRLADFGIARLVDTTRITAAATAIGTAAYMAPEQVQGHDVTPAADVYSLGLLLLELLTGQQAFTGSPQEVAVARLVRNPEIGPGVPGGWRDLLAAMTDRAAANRPSAAEVRDRLTVMVEGSEQATGVLAVMPPGPDPALATTSVRTAEGTTVMPATLIPASEPDPEAPRGRRGALVAMVAGLLALVLGAAAFGGDDPPTAPTTTASQPDTTVAPTTTTTVAIQVPPADGDEDDEAPPGKGKRRGEKGAKGDDDDD